LPPRRWCGQDDAGDHFIRTQDSLDLGRIARQTMEISYGHDTRGAAGTQQLDSCLERNHRYGHVRRMNRDAGVARAQDGVDAVDPGDRRTPAARRAFVAAVQRVVKVRAARALKQIAADRCLVAELARGAGEQRFGEHPVAAADAHIGGSVGIRGLGADANSAIGQVFNIPQRQAADVDEMGGPLDLELHQIEQIGAAADELGAASGDRGNRRARVCRAFVGKGLHRRAPFATSRMAATIFG